MTHQTDLLSRALEFIEDYEDVADGSDGIPQPNQAMVLAREIRAALSTPQADKVPAAEGASEKQQKLLELADRIDHEQLWARPFMEHRDWTQDQRDRMTAGVELRRYADLWKSNRWVVFPPVGPVHFSASTLDAAYEMAKRDEERKNPTPPAKLPQEAEVAELLAMAQKDGYVTLTDYVTALKQSSATYFAERNSARDAYRKHRDESDARGKLINIVLGLVGAEPGANVVHAVAAKLATPQPARAGAVEQDIAGALFSFIGWLTSSPERLVFSDKDWATPAVTALEKFAAKWSLSLDNPNIEGWHKALAAATTAATGGKGGE